eukprot:4811138-Pleurochrysis_carterae.AAC.1
MSCARARRRAVTTPRATHARLLAGRAPPAPCVRRHAQPPVPQPRPSVVLGQGRSGAKLATLTRG